MPKEKSDIVIIKKYPNRRLYDTSTSAYVTLEDLCDMVKQGTEFQVVDAKTDEDLTRMILTQIIFEQEQKGYNLLPIGFLRHVISFYGHNVSNVLPTYLEQMMQEFSQNQDKMAEMVGSMQDISPMDQWQKLGEQNMQMFEQTMNMFNPFAAGKPGDRKD